ncbi:polyprenyl synthetase family protein [Kitasatospora arboriphila]
MPSSTSLLGQPDRPGGRARPCERRARRLHGRPEHPARRHLPQLGPVSEALRDFLLDGGKRLRPAFCYWGWRGAGGSADHPGIADAAAALELLQASALVHDDLMDRSDTRRGLPSVHRRFEGLHRENGWRGDREQYGASAAVLLGDLLLIWCDELFQSSGLPDDAVRAAKPVFDLMRTEVMVGQYLDVLEPVAGDSADAGALDRAQTVLHYKSAKYTIERPLQVGALLAGAGPGLVEAYGAFGLPLGEAFQLRDDLLGVFGDPAVTGKPAGDDLREGKRTLLVAHAMRGLSPRTPGTSTNGSARPTWRPRRSPSCAGWWSAAARPTASNVASRNSSNSPSPPWTPPPSPTAPPAPPSSPSPKPPPSASTDERLRAKRDRGAWGHLPAEG